MSEFNERSTCDYVRHQGRMLKASTGREDRGGVGDMAEL